MKRALPVPAALALVLVLAIAAPAHKHPCAHTHAAGGATTCDTTNAACTVKTKTGTCHDAVPNTTTRKCQCRRAGVCTIEVLASLDPDVSGLPGPGDTRVCSVRSDPANVTFVAVGGMVVEEFVGVPDPLQGTVTLEYGSFADPSAVPVLLTDVALTLVAFDLEGMSTGPSLLSLPGGVPQNLVYDSTTGIIEPLGGEEGIDLAFTNDMMTDEPLVAWFQADLASDGSLLLFASGDSDAPGPVALMRWTWGRVHSLWRD